MISFAKQINNRPSKQGYYVIYLRVTQNGKRKFFKSTVALRKKSDWNNKRQEVRSSNPDHKKLNDTLDKEVEQLKELYRELAEDGIASLENIAISHAQSDTAQNHSFLDYVKKRVQDIYDAGQYRNYKKYNGFYNKLVAYQIMKGNGTLVDVYFKDITTSYVANFEQFLRKLPNEREPEKLLHVNTIEVVLKVFKSIVKRAIEIDKLMDYSANPFLTYNFHGVKTYKEKLDANEIQRIIALDIDEDTPLFLARDCFMFSFYCAGIRASDLIQLRWCNITSDGRLNYQMGKNHKNRDIILVPQAREILSHYSDKAQSSIDYIFPLLDGTDVWSKAITQTEKDVLPLAQKVAMFKKISSKNATINKSLKEIAKLAGISKVLSMHISRHSFARIAKDKGVDNSHVQTLLAHSSIKITEGYMGNFDTASTDQALVSIFKQPETADDERKKLIEQLKTLSSEDLATILAELKK